MLLWMWWINIYHNHSTRTEQILWSTPYPKENEACVLLWDAHCCHFSCHCMPSISHDQMSQRGQSHLQVNTRIGGRQGHAHHFTQSIILMIIMGASIGMAICLNQRAFIVPTCGGVLLPWLSCWWLLWLWAILIGWGRNCREIWEISIIDDCNSTMAERSERSEEISIDWNSAWCIQCCHNGILGHFRVRLKDEFNGFHLHSTLRWHHR